MFLFTNFLPMWTLNFSCHYFPHKKHSYNFKSYCCLCVTKPVLSLATCYHWLVSESDKGFNKAQKAQPFRQHLVSWEVLPHTSSSPFMVKILLRCRSKPLLFWHRFTFPFRLPVPTSTHWSSDNTVKTDAIITVDQKAYGLFSRQTDDLFL